MTGSFPHHPLTHRASLRPGPGFRPPLHQKEASLPLPTTHPEVWTPSPPPSVSTVSSPAQGRGAQTQRRVHRRTFPPVPPQCAFSQTCRRLTQISHVKTRPLATFPELSLLCNNHAPGWGQSRLPCFLLTSKPDSGILRLISQWIPSRHPHGHSWRQSPPSLQRGQSAPGPPALHSATGHCPHCPASAPPSCHCRALEWAQAPARHHGASSRLPYALGLEDPVHACFLLQLLTESHTFMLDLRSQFEAPVFRLCWAFLHGCFYARLLPQIQYFEN